MSKLRCRDRVVLLTASFSAAVAAAAAVSVGQAEEVGRWCWRWLLGRVRVVVELSP